MVLEGRKIWLSNCYFYCHECVFEIIVRLGVSLDVTFLVLLYNYIVADPVIYLKGSRNKIIKYNEVTI
jgi:hypothetical protein